MKTIGRLRVWRGRRSRGVLLLLAAGALGAGSLAAVAALDGRLPLPGARYVELAEPVRPVAPGLIRLDGDDGRRLLFESEAHAAFLPLTSHFETQLSLTHCGTASIVMVLNASLLSGYTFGCHSWRHLIGGRFDCFTCDGKPTTRYGIWKRSTWLNERHMLFAWLSLVWVAFTDFYIYLVSSGTIRDLNTW